MVIAFAEVVVDSHMLDLFRHYEPIVTYQSFSCCPYSFLAVRCQRYVCRAGMLARERPLRLTVSHNEAPWSSHIV